MRSKFTTDSKFTTHIVSMSGSLGQGNRGIWQACSEFAWNLLGTWSSLGIWSAFARKIALPAMCGTLHLRLRSCDCQSLAICDCDYVGHKAVALLHQSILEDACKAMQLVWCAAAKMGSRMAKRPDAN